jgi:steroid delta-isomerase-like uncharacterized protein
MSETHMEHGVDRDWAVEFAGRWAAAWNSHDPDRLLELMTQDIVYDDSAWPRTMRGRADVREFLDSTWRALPDLAFALDGGPLLEEGAPRAVLHWTAAGTFTGPLEPPGFTPTGARLAFDGFDLHEYRDGRVCRLRIVFDMMEVSRQAGLIPRSGSRIEQAGATAQRLGMRLRDRLRRR